MPGQLVAANMIAIQASTKDSIQNFLAQFAQQGAIILDEMSQRVTTQLATFIETQEIGSQMEPVEPHDEAVEVRDDPFQVHDEPPQVGEELSTTSSVTPSSGRGLRSPPLRTTTECHTAH
jgi:hypothetical protein